MLRRTATAVVMSTALLTGGAVAQTTPMSATPMSTTPATSMTTGSKFMTDQAIGQFRMSKFVGLDVYGSEGQKVGDINEVLVDGTGNAQAVVIGVGGFLGIGEKNVAVPFSALQWVNTRPASMGAAGPATVPASSITGTSTTGPASTTAMNRSETTAGSTMPERTPSEEATYNGYPDHGTIPMTKADLQNAPQFKYYAETHSRTSAPSNPVTTPSTTTTPPATR